MAESNASKFSSKITSDGTIGQGGLAAGVGGTDWQAVITADGSTATTAVAGEGYFIDTTSGAITITLPGTATVGDTIVLKDYNGTWATNNVTISSTLKISGADADGTLSTNNTTVTIVYMDTTKGWTPIQNSTQGALALDTTYISATGGTVTESGDFKIHTFTGDGCFVVSSVGSGGPSIENAVVDYLVVAGGAGVYRGLAAGGGAGGFRVSNNHGLPAPTMSPLSNPTGITVTATTYPITVGGGGSPGPSGSAGGATNGSNSVFSTITSTGGGVGGSSGNAPGDAAGQPGGSGGGGDYNGGTASGGTGNTPPTSPPQGNSGGTGIASGPYFGPGGAGGAGAAGQSASAPNGTSNGGIGSFISPSFAVGCAGTTGPVCGVRYFAGGGGGASMYSQVNGVPTGGAGGGGNAATTGLNNGTVNTGGGGAGGSGGDNGGSGGNQGGGAGGSGIVVIRYKFQ